MTEYILTQEVLKELLTYDPETGIFKWKRRDRKYCKSTAHQTTWNKRFSGKETNGLSVQGYVRISIFNKRYRAHRLAFLYMEGEFPKDKVDHWLGDRSDNRWSNIDHSSHLQNSRNLKRCKRNTTGITGLSWYEKNRRFMAYINVNYKTIYLGTYEDFFEACCARKSAEIKYGFHENHGRR